VRDEELAASGVFAGKRHPHGASQVGALIDFIANGVAGATFAVAARVAILDDEVGNDAMDGEAVEVTLARRGFFDGLPIHRVVPDFVIQGGDPRGDGEGGPGFTIRDEINQRPYLRGTVGMALDWADTGGSQFFITHSPQPHLDAKYTVFGRVIAGMEIVDQIQQGDVIRRIRVWDGATTSD
jgi:cyclophilin family peptidyl-prolyl cis-trans isomerase